MRPASDTPAILAEQYLRDLHSRADSGNVAGMARFGISSVGTLGVSMPEIRALAGDAKRRLGHDGAELLILAGLLWASGVHEGRIMAAILADPALIPYEVAEAWVLEIDSWDTCDQLCQNVLWRASFAWELPDTWTQRSETFVKRAGFVTAAQLGAKDKRESDERVISLLALADARVFDERNDVKKAASWMLRAISKRNAVCNAAAIEASEALLDCALSVRPSTNASKAARWVARDALREARAVRESRFALQ